MSYQRADFAPLRDTVYGIGVHWTTWTRPRTGPMIPFDRMVRDFDVDAFVALAADCGAGHVLFPTNHHIYHLPGPNPEVDRLIEGRTCERDLLMELADGLAARGIGLLFYHWHGLNPTSIPLQDPEFQQAVGAFEDDTTRYYDNLCRILTWMGEHYGPKVMAWWYDAGYHLETKGNVPWERITAASKAGHEGRLVCYNAGIEDHKCYTPFQDYWAGETPRLNYVPRGTLTPAGLPWYAFTDWHASLVHPSCGQWGIDMKTPEVDWPAPPIEAITWYLNNFRAADGVVTFNLLCYADGSVVESDRVAMCELRKAIRGTVGVKKQK